MPNPMRLQARPPESLAEARSLCAGNGYRSGWAHLRPVVG